MTEKTDRKHSPTPWREKYYAGPGLFGVMDSEGRRIAECFGAYSQDMDSKANAAYIVEAVNSHERLAKENARLAEDLADTNEYVTHLQDHLKHYRTMVDLVRRMIHPTETTLAFAIKDGEKVKRIYGTEEAEKLVDECIAALQNLLAEARAAIGEEVGNG